MNASDQQAHKAHKANQDRLRATVEVVMFGMLSSKLGRIALAHIVNGSDNLWPVPVKGREFSDVAYDLGRQYAARNLILTIRRSRRCSDLFDQALREYQHEYGNE